MLVGFASSGLMTCGPIHQRYPGGRRRDNPYRPAHCFKFFDYALLLVGAGFLLIFGLRRKVPESVGQAILGFGFIFFAMKLMSDAMVPLRDSEVMKSFWSPGSHPFWALILSAAFSALVHSSAATIAWRYPVPARADASHRGHSSDLRREHRYLRHGAGQLDRTHTRQSEWPWPMCSSR